MRPDDIRELLRRRPLPLLRLHLTNGTVFEVRHPDMATLGRSALHLVLPAQDGVEREAVIAMLHVIWIEVLISPAQQ
jgi:hypothetical protein